MLIAHAPAGYIIAKKMNCERKPLVIASMVFALLPDLDLLYYYTANRQELFHHYYFPHLPLALLTCFCFAWLLLKLLKRETAETVKPYFLLLFLNWFVHLLLDTVTGGIAWLYPLSSEMTTLLAIPAAYSHWVLSFVLHWSFLFELGIVAFALLLFRRARKSSSVTAAS